MLVVRFVVAFFAVLMLIPTSNSGAIEVDTDGSKNIHHNWKKTSTEIKVIDAGTHEYSVFHNFIKKTRKCDISHKVKTEVWFCDLHNHTKSEISLDETVHSYEHS